MGEKKKISKPKTENIRKPVILEKNKIKDRIIRYIWVLFEAEKEKEEKKIPKSRSIYRHYNKLYI